MQVKYLAGIVGAALLLAGCSSSNELTSAGQNVRFVQEKPGAECQLLGTATGKQSNWLSGQNGDEGSSPTQNLLSSFVPTDSEMNGQVYKCPN
ncbi:MAG: DUF4156 domain-containing protein [Klebsiella sp.]|nr:DUF4156 domain-containing protein [Klebsiella sp.]